MMCYLYLYLREVGTIIGKQNTVPVKTWFKVTWQITVSFLSYVCYNRKYIEYTFGFEPRW